MNLVDGIKMDMKNTILSWMLLNQKTDMMKKWLSVTEALFSQIEFTRIRNALEESMVEDIKKGSSCGIKTYEESIEIKVDKTNDIHNNELVDLFKASNMYVDGSLDVKGSGVGQKSGCSNRPDSRSSHRKTAKSFVGPVTPVREYLA
ncbi:hypothetical protein L2E82_07365 [Cichorium intybus]|uniref:Uncharacterized protein n=1 Tax=Cichorium intybus TaxID=13427 RepID=A0ACB9G481_CICIN|nr:hypothetical protein L2E82_07365 [Cichorium intybus]